MDVWHHFSSLDNILLVAFCQFVRRSRCARRSRSMQYTAIILVQNEHSEYKYHFACGTSSYSGSIIKHLFSRICHVFMKFKAIRTCQVVSSQKLPASTTISCWRHNVMMTLFSFYTSIVILSNKIIQYSQVVKYSMYYLLVAIEPVQAEKIVRPYQGRTQWGLP